MCSVGLDFGGLHECDVELVDVRSIIASDRCKLDCIFACGKAYENIYRFPGGPGAGCLELRCSGVDTCAYGEGSRFAGTVCEIDFELVLACGIDFYLDNDIAALVEVDISVAVIASVAAF